MKMLRDIHGLNLGLRPHWVFGPPRFLENNLKAKRPQNHVSKCVHFEKKDWMVGSAFQHPEMIS